LEIATKHDVFTLEGKWIEVMFSRQLVRAEKNPRTFNSFSNNEGDLGHILSMLEDDDEILRLRLRMKARIGNRPAAKF
jgi:hypothetical protein